jgi:hypothetical protein
MFTKGEIIKIVKEQLAIECNCLANDFDRHENIITLPELRDNRRKFSDMPFFFNMTTMGGNAVISADKCLHDWLSDFIKDKEGHCLFEHTNLREIDKQLSLFGKRLCQTHHMFLPFGKSKPLISNVQVKWYEQEEIHQFYGDKRFPSAFGSKYYPERPDMLAVAAIDGTKIVGMAGCSADTPLLWQIGIDVDDNYRSKGIGTLLVMLLKDEIFVRDKIPYYGTSLSNVYSQRIALNSGFCPAWIGIETIEQ